MRLQADAPAPALPATDHQGQPLPPPGRHGRLMAFFRYADCPICNLRVRDLRRAVPELREAGLEVVAVFQSPADHLAHSLGGEAWPFPLVADAEMHHYKAWGVGTSWAGLVGMGSIGSALKAFRAGHMPGRIDGPVHRMPADFVTDAGGRIALAHYGQDAGDHLPLEQVWRWLRTQNA